MVRNGSMVDFYFGKSIETQLPGKRFVLPKRHRPRYSLNSPQAVNDTIAEQVDTLDMRQVGHSLEDFCSISHQTETMLFRHER